MSFDLIKRVLESVHDVTPAEKLILVAFANFARQSKISWPATATIAAMCGLSERQTRRHIEALKKAGHIKESGWSKIRTKVYALNLPDRTCATGDRTPMTGQTGHPRHPNQLVLLINLLVRVNFKNQGIGRTAKKKRYPLQRKR